MCCVPVDILAAAVKSLFEFVKNDVAVGRLVTVLLSVVGLYEYGLWVPGRTTSVPPPCGRTITVLPLIV